MNELYLLSKEAIKLPPRQRLELLLKAKKYPIVRKRTSAEGQIKEMIDFYKLCCVLLTQYFSNEEAECDFFVLNIIASQEKSKLITEKISKALKILGDYEMLEDKVTAIQMLFYRYKKAFPEIYEAYDLESYAYQKVGEIITDTKKLISDDPDFISIIKKRWDLMIESGV